MRLQSNLYAVKHSPYGFNTVFWHEPWKGHDGHCIRKPINVSFGPDVCNAYEHLAGQSITLMMGNWYVTHVLSSRTISGFPIEFPYGAY